ncbi:carbon storage regulator CsrA [Halobacteroides halobius DSM 5150]|uniref:Translational regulator CsrA n=1 Tax=Halobacteroides halobius (strain ATCC 35273 / DSM 5150 / MD-1) TaxID=748449 RepID=L0KC66_HALHC|nr:carbon storage regulator CsrA [Halobacteroides halobius]AGB42145.1 carbon storage regulator CsrA [Halobacteroides halobius DSM 5150]
MLVLTRKENESIMVGDNIEITVVEAGGGQVRLGIDAPQDIEIHRKEIYQEIEATNKEAASQKVGSLSELIKKISNE